MGGGENRGLIKACGFGAASCFEQVRGGWDRIADTVIGALQAPPQPRRAGTPSVVWDGTFPHPNVRSFYILKGLVPMGANSSSGACSQLPDVLQKDSHQLLLKLVCDAHRELSADGPGRWSLERTELDELRTIFVACLPPATSVASLCSKP